MMKVIMFPKSKPNILTAICEYGLYDLDNVSKEK